MNQGYLNLIGQVNEIIINSISKGGECIYTRFYNGTFIFMI